MKQCSVCKNLKDEIDFHKDKSAKSGLASSCKDCSNASNRVYRKKNADNISLKKKEHRLNNINEFREKDRVSYRRRAEKERERVAEYRLRNKDKIDEYLLVNKERIKQTAAKERRKLRAMVITHYGGMCECCGEQRHEFLAIDHISGGGNQHRKEIGNKGGHSFYRHLKKNNFPEGYRVLCHNCNHSLGSYGYCPHKTEVHGLGGRMKAEGGRD